MLEKKLDAKQAVELEIERLRGQLNVMKHMGDDDLEVLKKMDEIHNNLKEKEEEFVDLESLYQTLVVQERKSNDELQEARKELIEVSVLRNSDVLSFIYFSFIIFFDEGI